MKRVKVRHLFDFLPKSRIKAGDGLHEGAYPFYTSSENQSKYLNKYLYEPGCLVFGTGGKASIHLTTRRFATSTDCITMRPKPNSNIDAGYVYQYFKRNMQVLESGFKGAGLKHISKAFISDIQIPHHEELYDQIRIAHLLNKAERLIAQRKHHLQQLDDLLKSVFLEMFGNPVRNERGWATSPIEGLCEGVIDCPHSTPIYTSEKTGYYCVRSGDIANGYLDLGKTYHVNELVFLERIRRYKPQIGDIVYSREGGRLGNAARIIGKVNICLGQRMMLFKVNAENRSEFLWALLESAPFKLKLQRLVGGGAAPRVNIKDVKNIIVIKPPVDEQKKFSAIVGKIDELKAQYQLSLTELENLYGALSQRAFKGELDVGKVMIEHIVPLSAGYSHTSENIAVIPSSQDRHMSQKPKKPIKATVQDDRFSYVAEQIKKEFAGFDFQFKDIIESRIFDNYRHCNTTEDLKKKALSNEYDLKCYLFDCLEGKSSLLKLKQFYFDALNDLQLTSINFKVGNDLIKEQLKESQIKPEELNGIYFRVIS